MTKYFFDCEFMEDGKTIELLSIGMVCEDGREFYAENYEADVAYANEFVAEHVLPYLGQDLNAVRYRKDIALDIRAFVMEPPQGEAWTYGKPEFWAYYADYDWVVLCQLFGTMMDLPRGWPMMCMDVKQLCVSLGDPPLPKQSTTEHHALNDARWTRETYNWLAQGQYQAMGKGQNP